MPGRRAVLYILHVSAELHDRPQHLQLTRLFFSSLNADDAQVYVSPIKHFGRGWGETCEGNLLVTVESEGLYNILVIATRIDPDAVAEFAEFQVERYEDPALL